ncbi:MAG TPA: type II secretion system protein GspM [Thermomonas sp.]|jgi:general secretion pathway protein M|uniref:type II secretion system protein GspM n=1 Tax=Thermomonas sp. TaxID=1971895 RepID=UPI002BC08A0B|nr:type II secretion system protein GspM [Thermomonas sp.]HOV95224.1 type II secretion system protein GspM [Thermomonas sp.]
MSPTKTPSARDRWLALALLLVVSGLLWLLLWPLFGQPLQQANAELAELQTRDARLRSVLGQKTLVEQRLAALAARGGGSGFLSEPTAELATAGLIQQLEQVVSEASPGSRGCALVNRTPLGDEAQNGRYRRVTVQVRLRCGNAETLAVLHALQSARPYLFIDGLAITAQRYFAVPGSGQPQEGGLDVNFNLYGYLRPGPGGARGH